VSAHRKLIELILLICSHFAMRFVALAASALCVAVSLATHGHLIAASQQLSEVQGVLNNDLDPQRQAPSGC
jgi:hypothetical protein